VCAMLFRQALGTEHLKLLHIDNGLMRKNESEGVVSRYQEIGLGPSLHHVDATEDFLTPLAGLTEPEAKRKVIGDTFVAVFEREARRLDIEHAMLGQGTIYPDTIETGGTKRSEVIKTHHNRVPLIQEMMAQGRVIEPLKDLYKTEVRDLGRALGLDPASIDRHPFPGPGLGIRVAATTSVAEDFDEAGIRSAVDSLLGETGLKGLPLPVRSVGVKADLRSYEHPVLLTGANPGWERLTKIATGLAKEVPGINRCLYRLNPGASQEAKLIAATITAQRLDLLRELDQIVMDALKRHDLMDVVWQCPTVLVPISLDGQGQELVVIRPVHSERAMTARPAWIGEECAADITRAVMAYEPVGAVAIDITSKPPATIEWE
jgi:GMP synthase (glutamine-hydrolysing)